MQLSPELEPLSTSLSRSGQWTRIRALHQALYGKHGDAARESWTITEAYKLVEMLRCMGGEDFGPAADIEARLDAARSRGVRYYRDSFTAVPMSLVVNDMPIETDAQILMRLFKMPEKYAAADARMLELEGTDVQKHVAVADWCTGILTNAALTRKGLFLYSPVNGNGKSTSAALAFARIVLPKVRAGERNVRAAWWSAADLFANLRNAFDLDRAKEPGDIPDVTITVERLMKTPLLVIDDLSKARPSSWVQEQLLRIIEARDETLPTIITSNISVEGLTRHFDSEHGRAIVSRLGYGSFARLEFKGADYRRVQPAQQVSA